MGIINTPYRLFGYLVILLLLVSCGGGGGSTTTTTTYTVGGVVYGLASPGTVTLTNGAQSLTTSGGSFSASSTLVAQSTYTIAVAQQPTKSVTCAGGSGTVVFNNVTNLLVYCEPTTLTSTVAVSTFSGNYPNLGQFDSTLLTSLYRNPTGLALNTLATLLYAADTGNNAIRKIDVNNSAVTTLIGPTSGATAAGYATGTKNSVRFSNPTAVAVDASGNIYVADAGNFLIRLFDSSGLETIGFAGSPQVAGTSDGAGTAARFTNPTDLAIDVSGNIYVCDNNLIRKITATGTVSTWVNLGVGVLATGVAVDRLGYVYVATSTHLIKRISSDATVSNLAGSGIAATTDGLSTAAAFNTPTRLAVDAYSNVFVSESAGMSIRMIKPDGTVLTFAGTGAISIPPVDSATGTLATFNTPMGLAITSAGQLYVADKANNIIRLLAAPY